MSNGSKPPGGAISVSISASYGSFTRSESVSIPCSSEDDAQSKFYKTVTSVIRTKESFAREEDHE